MNLYSFAILLVILSSVYLFYMVANRPQRTKAHNAFLTLNCMTALWAVTSFMVDSSPLDATKLTLAKLAYLFGFLATYSIYYFSTLFPHALRQPLIVRLIGWGLLVAGIAINVGSGVVDYVEPREGQATIIHVGSLYILFVVLLLILFVWSVANFIWSFRHSNHQERIQIFFALMGIILGFVWVVLTSVVGPVILDNWQISLLAPAGVIFLTGSIGYGIIRHQLFDVRETVARGSAYLLSLGSIAAIYFGVIYILTGAIQIDLTMDIRIRLIYLGVAIITGLTFQPLKRFFDKITNRLFYRDAYDPQQLIDEISNLLVSNYELDRLGDMVANAVVRHMKVEFCSFYVADASKQHLFGTKKDITFMKADDITRQMGAKIVLIDKEKVDATAMDDLLKKEVLKTGANLVAKLETTTASVGAMFLGPKKSGVGISQADIKVIDIFTDEVAIAFQNATRFEEISTFNATLQQKIEAATQELTRTNQKLKALDEAKDEFISMASHQLRTPLTSIKGYLSLVLEGDLGEITPQQRQLLSQAFTSSQRMVYLISDLLNVSRLQTGKFTIEPSEVYLPDMVSEEMKQVEETAKAKKIKLSYKKPKSFPSIQLDDNKIRQVMMNFMDNAIYYTPSGGKVSIELEAKKRSVEFRVVDNGMGVPKAEQHKLFTKFYRANNARSVRPDGTGLGLFMAKKVIVASGGALIFKSTEGKGSTFGFSFPLSSEE